jgi:hypothetical protein
VAWNPILDTKNSREASTMEELMTEPEQKQKQKQNPEEPEGRKALADTHWVLHLEEDVLVKTPSICHQLFQVLLGD